MQLQIDKLFWVKSETLKRNTAKKSGVPRVEY